jgi:hypothetical protein
MNISQMPVKTICALAVVAALSPAQTPAPLTSEQVAAAASAMLDGDVCERIQTPRSLEYQNTNDPRDPWRASDNYDVDDQAFNQTKKQLIRLSRLCASACDVNLWMPVARHPGRIAIVIRNVHEMSQFWHWGDLDQPTPPAMQRALSTAQIVTVRQKPGMLSVLAPVRNSLGDIVAIAEVATEEKPDPRENVK